MSDLEARPGRLRWWWGWIWAVPPILGGLILAVPSNPPPPAFRVGVQGWPGYAPAYLARAEGGWPPDRIRLVELPTDAEIIRAMEAEALEAACVTLDGALRLQAGGGDLRVIAVADTSVGGDAVVAVREGLDSVADLRGKRVAAESHGVGIVFLARALRAAGLGLDEVVFINADIPEHGRLIAGGLVDAVVTYSPEKERLVGAGGVVLCDSARLPGEVIDVLVVRADAFRENGEAVGALLAGWLDAADRLEGDPGARRRVAGLMGMSPAEYEAGRRVIRIPGRAEVRSLCLGPSPGLAGRAREVAEELRSLDLLPGPVDPGRLLLSPEEAGVLRW